MICVQSTITIVLVHAAHIRSRYTHQVKSSSSHTGDCREVPSVSTNTSFAFFRDADVIRPCSSAGALSYSCLLAVNIRSFTVQRHGLILRMVKDARECFAPSLMLHRGETFRNYILLIISTMAKMHVCISKCGVTQHRRSEFMVCRKVSVEMNSIFHFSPPPPNQYFGTLCSTIMTMTRLFPLLNHIY